MKINNLLKAYEDLMEMKSNLKEKYNLSAPAVFTLIIIKVRNFKNIKEIVEYKKNKFNLDEKQIKAIKVKLTNIVKELEEKEFITRTCLEVDKRIQILNITDKASPLLEEAIGANYG